MTALHDFHFLRPFWLLALPLFWAVVYWLASRRSRGQDWSQVIDANLLPDLTLSEKVSGGGTPWPWLTLTWTLAVLALAGPSWLRAPSPAFRGNEAWVLVLDLSPSMMATDLAPNRITRARYGLDDLLNAAHDVRVGLVVFGGEAFTVTPLTDDVATVHTLLPPLAPSILPVAGDALAPALERASQLLTQTGVERGHVVVLSDGFADPAASFDAARAIHSHGVAVDVVGIGTHDGVPLANADGGFARNAQGGIKLMRIDADRLRQLAASGGGRYVDLASLPDLIADLKSSAGQTAQALQTKNDVRVTHWLDGGIWLLPLILLPAAALARRRWLQ